jgi:hypothetical protein
MPETLDPFVFTIDAAFDAVDEEIDLDDDPAGSLLEYLACAKEQPAPPARRRSGRLVSLIIERDGR